MTVFRVPSELLWEYLGLVSGANAGSMRVPATPDEMLALATACLMEMECRQQEVRQNGRGAAGVPEEKSEGGVNDVLAAMHWLRETEATEGEVQFAVHCRPLDYQLEPLGVTEYRSYPTAFDPAGALTSGSLPQQPVIA